MMKLPIITHEYIIKGSGKLPNLDVPIGIAMLNNMRAYPNHSLVEGDTGRSITHRELLQQMVAIAEWLKSKGMKPGDVIGICSENRVEFAAPLGATLFIGAAINPLNPLYTIDELKHVLSISKPRIVFVSPLTASKFLEVKKHLPFVEELVLFDPGMNPVDGFTSFTQLVKRDVDVNSYRCEKVNPRESVAAVLCSSGTTGLPKCVELVHSNLRCFVDMMEYRRLLTDRGTEAILGLVPFFHGYGLYLLVSSMVLNLKIVVLAKFEEKTFLSAIEKYRVNRLHIVPPLALFLAKHPLVSKYDLSSVKYVTCGAAPLSKEIENEIKNRLKSVIQMGQGYGMTELSIAVTVPATNEQRDGSVGVVAPEMECKVVDVETGKALPPLKEGELWFRGPFTMKGYKSNPTATAEMIDSDGWLHTGDIGYYDQDGFMFIVDRMKELIKFKGFQVAPAELEAILLTNPKIKDAAAIGLPNEEAGELPMAFVVLAPGAKATEEEIKKFVADKVSPQKRLHAVRFVEQIPKNPSGKILRKELRKLLQKSKL